MFCPYGPAIFKSPFKAFFRINDGVVFFLPLRPLSPMHYGDQVLTSKIEIIILLVTDERWLSVLESAALGSKWCSHTFFKTLLKHDHTHTDLKYQSFVVSLNKFTQPMVQLSAKTRKSTSICIQVFRVYHTSSIENCTNLNTDKKQTISSGYFWDNSTDLKL